MLYYGQKFLLRKNNMALYSCLRITFLCLAGIFFLFTLLFEIWQKKWKRGCFDIFVYLIQMPLRIILGITVLKVLPDLSYSYFSGIWLFSELLLWIISHSMMEEKTFRRKKRFDMACSIAGILAIISFCVFIYFWNLLPNTFGTVTDKKFKSRKLLSFSWHFAVVSEKKSFRLSWKVFSVA